MPLELFLHRWCKTMYRYIELRRVGILCFVQTLRFVAFLLLRSRFVQVSPSFPIPAIAARIVPINLPVLLAKSIGPSGRYKSVFESAKA